MQKSDMSDIWLLFQASFRSYAWKIMRFRNIMDLRHFANSTCLDVAWIMLIKNLT